MSFASRLADAFATFDQSEVLLKCRVSRGMFSGERTCLFTIGEKSWSTCQSAWMCYRASDLKLAKEVPEDEEYDGLAEIKRVGKNYVRYWFGPDTESSGDLDPTALRAALTERPESTLRGR